VLIHKPTVLINTNHNHHQVFSKKSMTRMSAARKKTGFFLSAKDPDRQSEDQYFAGIDVGSRATKAVILKEDRIQASTILNTGANVKKAAERSLARVCELADIKIDCIGQTIGTGYGRVSIPFADKTVTELSCHAMGCFYLNPDIRTVIDIGGQDSKVIRLDNYGGMADFVMNDKCAAGTGKFFEMVAHTLETDLATMAEMTIGTTKKININSMCVVFAETEIISLLLRGEKVENLVSAINRAFSMRIGNMVKRLGIRDRVAFVGGVAKNKGLRLALEDFLGKLITPLDIDPQLTGALGAAVLAQQPIREKRISA
jgi:predicted CoA-substrate-specific enzyme activase